MIDFLVKVLAVVILLASLGAQTPDALDEPMRIGPGVTAPKVTRKVEPVYSPEARANYVQGSVMLQIVVSEKGKATDITVLSPLGYGLDEKAQEAIAKWEFVPGKKDGVPVNILATVEVNFRFLGIWFDDKTERRRTRFNVALQRLGKNGSDAAAVEKAVSAVRELGQQKYSPAQFVAGMWLIEGEYGAKDPVAGLAMIQDAAAKHYGPAIYEIGIRRIQGRDLPIDLQKGLQELREAATLGSPHAQFHLGVRYEKGDGVPLELDRARRYFRLCAAQGVALCQYRLGNLLYTAQDRREREYMQALAWLQLAAEQNVKEAKTVAASDIPKLTAEQRTWMESLKRQMVRK